MAFKTNPRLGTTLEKHSFNHSSDRKDIFSFIQEVLLTPSSPRKINFQYTFDLEPRPKNIVKLIYFKLNQIINLKYALGEFNFKIHALRYFFKKVTDVLYEPKYDKSYFIELNQFTKIKK